MNKLILNKKVINIIDNHDNLDYALDNESLIINFFSHEAKDMEINFILNNDCYLVINYSCLVYDDININIKGIVKGDNNKCVINVRTLGEKNHANINVNIGNSKNSKNNEIIENLKGIIDNGTIAFMPILEMKTNDVSAEHFATIGKIDENELFYLQTKGLSKAKASLILKNNFMYNLFDKNFLQMLEGGIKKDE